MPHCARDLPLLGYHVDAIRSASPFLVLGMMAVAAPPRTNLPEYTVSELSAALKRTIEEISAMSGCAAKSPASSATARAIAIWR